MTCELSIIAPLNLSEYLTYTNVEVETNPAPFDPDLSYVNKSLSTYAGAVWRFLGDENTPVGKYPSDGRVNSQYYAPLHESVKGRTLIKRWNGYITFQKNEWCYSYTYSAQTGYVYSRYRSKTAGNRGNDVSNVTHWEFMDNSRDSYIYMPLHDSTVEHEVGHVFWLPDNPNDPYASRKFTQGRAWVTIQTVPAQYSDVGGLTPTPDALYPPTLSTEDTIENADEQFWEFVRLTQPLRFFDVSPFTQAEWEDEIILGLTIDVPATDIALINVDADEIEINVNSGEDNLVNESISMTQPITRLWHFREPRRSLLNQTISNIPYSLSADYEIKIKKPSGIAKLGSAIIGQKYTLGGLRINSSSGGASLGQFQTDNFETLGLQQGRGTSDRDYIVKIDDGRHNAVLEYMESIKGNIVYVLAPEGFESLGGLGRIADFDMSVKQPNYYLLNIHLEGITDYDN